MTEKESAYMELARIKDDLEAVKSELPEEVTLDYILDEIIDILYEHDQEKE